MADVPRRPDPHDAHVVRRYRTTDRIQNLRVRVVLAPERPGAVSQTVDASALRDGADASVLSASALNRTQAESSIVAVVGWQQKLFGPAEYQRYRHRPEPKTPLDKRYVQEVLSQDRPSTIFTYVDVDSNPPNQAHMTSSPMEGATRLADTVTAVYAGGKKAHHFHDLSYKVMRIMAALGEANDGGAPEEVCLCTMKWHGNGLLEMRPGLSARPYQLIKSDAARFQYWLALDDHQLELLELQNEREEQLQRELYQQTADLRKNLVGDEFKEPPADLESVIVRGQFATAYNFDDANIYMQYLVDVPQHWTADRRCSLALCSQLCRARPSRVDDREVIAAHFGLPLELEFQHNIAEPTATHTRPRIAFQVCSIDWWDRQRVEGYGHFIVPDNPGMYRFEVPTWKPIGSVRDQLRSAFIGGSPKLIDLKYASGTHNSTSAANTHERSARHSEPALTRYGLQTVPSGTVIVVVDVGVQRKLSAAELKVFEMDALRSSALLASLVRTRSSEPQRTRVQKDSAFRAQVLERARRRVATKRAAQASAAAEL